MTTILKIRNNLVSPYLLRIIVCVALFFVVTGCSGNLSDLEAWVEEVKARPQEGIEPLPEIMPYKAFAYVKGSKRDPFDTSIFRPQVASVAKKISVGISPDPNRVPEYLESFPLDTLRMVGTMSQEKQNWALIKTPDNTIQRVLTGNYLGQNNGKIIDVSNDGVELVEIIPDGFGGWRERESSIALSE